MNGNNAEIERIVKTYSTFLLRLVMHDTGNRMEAEDIVQETFIRFLKKAPQFIDEEHEKAWLIRVVSNQVKDIHKSRWHRKTRTFSIISITYIVIFLRTDIIIL